jgi:catechol 2,3-dioxygenase-like lactoylglutathione lyase family enzyme
MDRINHVKIVTPDPTAVETFLTEVLDIPRGWSLGELGQTPDEPARSPAREEDGSFTMDAVMRFRGAVAEGQSGGVIVGDPSSRQFQIFQAEKAHVWAVAVGTRHLERAHERCSERGIPCTDLAKTRWGDGAIEFFFAEVGGIVFEVLRAAAS